MRTDICEELVVFFILVLQPAALPESDPSCTLIEESLDTPGLYESLSYAWDHPFQLPTRDDRKDDWISNLVAIEANFKS